jgi:hypothetical protein
MRIRQNVGGRSVAETVRSLAALILFSFWKELRHIRSARHWKTWFSLGD